MGFGGGLLVGVFGGGGEGLPFLLFSRPPFLLCAQGQLSFCACLRRCAPVCALDEHKQTGEKKESFLDRGRDRRLREPQEPHELRSDN
jgi:hypothetical protein